jgi:DNA invertase Pin-like site-specific DNA recombinase
MQQAIGYLRVSTREQGRSGLGLAAERFDIQAFAAREGFAVQSWYQDIQTGAGRDPLTLRPALATALKKARAAHCPLIVSSLDRLSRNVHFIASLLEHHVHFVVAQLGRDCDEFTLHIYACLAEQERKLISERAKATAEVEKTRGRQFGLQLRSRAWQRRVRALGKAALVQEANDRAQAFRAKQVAARCALEHPLGVRGAEVMLKRVRRAAALRSALHQRVGWPLDRWTALRIRIGGILQRHPEFTGPQVLERLGPAGAPRLIWVWQVMGEVHAATRRPSAHARHKGKRFYPLWRDPKFGRPGALGRVWSAAGVAMRDAIGYLRVSTREQGRSGLGLAAQRHDIDLFAAKEGFSVGAWYQDIQTGGVSGGSPGWVAVYPKPSLTRKGEANSSASRLLASHGYLDRVQTSTLVCGVPSEACDTTVSIICLPPSDSEKTRVFAACPLNPPPITKIRRLGIVIDTTS